MRFRFYVKVLRGGLLFALVFTFVLFPSGSPANEFNSHEFRNSYSALIYLIQPAGPKRHLYMGRRWIGEVTRNSFLVSQVEPGEHLIWTSKGRVAGSMYFAAGSINYVSIGAKEITLLDPAQGQSIIESSVQSKHVDERSDDPEEDSSRYLQARAQAVKSGQLEPCRFAKEKEKDLRRRAGSGDINASIALGNLYWRGDCRLAEYETAARWYREAANQGHLGAMVTLGNMYYRGTNVALSPEVAAYWYHTAAAKGDKFAQTRLAAMYRDGYGVDANTEESAKWRTQAEIYGRDKWALLQEPSLKDRNESRDFSELGGSGIRETISIPSPASSDPWSLMQEQTTDGNLVHPEDSKVESRVPNDKSAIEARLENRPDVDTRTAANQGIRQKDTESRIRNRRLTRIKGNYGHIGVNVESFHDTARVQPPKGKRPATNGSGWSNKATLMFPPEIALGVAALGLVYNAVEKSMKSRLSRADRARIEAAEPVISRLFAEEPIVERLQESIVSVGVVKDGEPGVFKPLKATSFTSPDYGRTQEPKSMDMILDLATIGIGLLLADEKFRKSHLVMSNMVTLRRRSDRLALKERHLCYVSKYPRYFSDWAANGGKFLKNELSSAYVWTADSVLLILAGEAYSTDAQSTKMCAALHNAVEIRNTALNETTR